MLRTKVDYLTLKALSLIKPHFLDGGSKWHKLVGMTYAPFTAVRAPLYLYDIDYKNRYEKILHYSS